MKKRILVTAGGTAIAWHISEIIKEYFSDKAELYICDINDSNLVPSSINATKTFKVPPVSEKAYEEAIEKIITENKIDIVIPLLPREQILLAPDSKLIKRLNIVSSAPTLNTTNLLTDKYNLFKTLTNLGVPTPKIYLKEDIDEGNTYIVKPRYGFGSREVSIKKGKELERINLDNEYIIQEYCGDNEVEEVTVECFNNNGELSICARRRIETKSGVCTKASFISDLQFREYINKLCSRLEMPVCFNVQFIKHNSVWKLFDCNLRLAAGTPLSTAAGFQLTRAFISKLLDLKIPKDILITSKDVKSVLRVYKEIVMK